MDTSNHLVRIWRSWFCKWQPRKFHQSRCSKSPGSLNLDRCASLTSQQKHRMTSCWRAIAWRWNCQPSLGSSSTSQICSLVFQFSLPWQFYLPFNWKNMLKFNDILYVLDQIQSYHISIFQRCNLHKWCIWIVLNNTKVMFNIPRSPPWLRISTKRYHCKSPQSKLFNLFFLLLFDRSLLF